MAESAPRETIEEAAEDVEDVEDVEEDWSSMMAAADHAKTGSSSGYASYDRMNVRISDECTLRIDCVSDLSPLDMIDMYHGVQDATGNKIWTGAFLFVEAFARPLPPPGEGGLSDDEESVQRTRLHLMDLRKRAFKDKRVLELGSGTGVAGLSILKVGANRSSSFTFTDSDAAALALCKRNCELNLELDQDNGYQYNVCELTWGKCLLSSSGMNAASSSLSQELLRPETYDTIVATDVLYDISSLPPLIQTASQLLKSRGYFILSHVPRASINDGGGSGGESTVVASAKVLEELIIEECSRKGLDHRGLVTIRPNELAKIWGGEVMCSSAASFTDMIDVGAAILVFLKV